MKRAFLFVFLVATLPALPIPAQEAAPAKAAQPPAKAKVEAIDFERAAILIQKRNRGETLSAEELAFVQKAIAARRAAQGGKAPNQPQRPAIAQVEKTGFKPLTEMTASDRYKDQDGGLYGGGRNTPPDELRKAAEVEIAKIKPLDKDGKPDAEGTIGFVSISMSNATQEFSFFKPLADRDPAKSPRVTIVDCAQGGQAMAEWVDPSGNPWQVAAQRLQRAEVSPLQVQVAWIKLANKGPRGDLQEHGTKLQKDTTAVVQNAKARFPNLRLVLLGSRIYGGYTAGALNPEPYAYESAFVVRWLIQDQMQGNPALNYDPAKGAVKAPLIVWGPYFWGDGLVWKREDFANDGTHPSQSGREKVARMLLDFCKSDPLANTWFAAGRN